VQSPLLVVEILDPHTRFTPFRGDRKKQGALVIRFSKSNVGVALVSLNRRQYRPVGYCNDLDTDSGNGFNHLSPCLPMGRTHLRGSGPGIKSDQKSIRRERLGWITL